MRTVERSIKAHCPSGKSVEHGTRSLRNGLDALSGLPRSAGGKVRSGAGAGAGAGAGGGVGQRSAQTEFSFWALKESREAVPPAA